MTMQKTVRIFFTGLLVYFVWRETGWATATAIALISLGQELTSYAIGNIIN